jgi:hypothetical protein
MGDTQDNAGSLIETANLRAYTVKNNATNMLGTGPKSASGLTDSFSKPIAEFDSRGSDVAFALSYGEAAGFSSKSYQWGGGTADQNNEAAVNNFAELTIPENGEGYDNMWLRSPGGSDNTASALFANGRVFQTFIDGTNSEYGLVYPALWVDQGIFN